MRDEFEALALCGGGLVGLEKGPDNLQPADVLVHSVDNSSPAVKFSVVHRLQPSADFAEARSGKLARQTVVNSNICARMPACPRLGWLFCPFVLEAISTWGGRARHLTQLAGLGGRTCIFVLLFFPQRKKNRFFSSTKKTWFFFQTQPWQLANQKYALRHQCLKKEAGDASRTRLQRSLLHGLSRQLERAYPSPLGGDHKEIHNDHFWF